MTSARVSATDHISAFDLDLLELGELDEDKRLAIGEHLRVCPACQGEREALRKVQADFSGRVMQQTVGRVRDRIRATSAPIYARPAFWASAWASAAALALWVATGRPGLRSRSADGEDVQAKGEADLQLVARHEGRVLALDGYEGRLTTGDEVRFVVTIANPARPFLLVASVDGTGRPNIYYPYDGKESARVDHRGRWEVPGSIVLDDSPGPERIFAVFSKEPLAAGTVTRALASIADRGWDGIRAAERLDLENVEQASRLVEKQNR